MAIKKKNTALSWIVSEAKDLKKKYPKRFSTWKEYVAQASAIYASKHKGKSPVGKKKIAAPAKVKKTAVKKSPVRSMHKDTKSHNVNIRVVSGYDIKRQILEYGAIYDTSLQLYLVKFANLSFSLWAVTGEGLKKALQHPEGKNQTAIVYRVKSYGIPKFEKMKVSELKSFK